MAFEYPSTITARKEKKQKQIDAKVDKGSKTYDKKLKKYLGSKETQLHSKDFDKGNERAESRAASETMQEYRTNLRDGGCAQLKGFGKARKPKKKKYA